MKPSTLLLALGLATTVGLISAGGEASAESGRQIHVALRGSDGNDGSQAKPLRTISAAAELARPGDVITVHEGTYRECIDPPRGGTSGDRRIVYQAAQGEKVVIKGSEVVEGWKNVQHDTWRVSVPNTLFGDFNPFADPIKGDWFNPKGRPHHAGAVYLDGHWLIEAANREDVLKPFGETSASYSPRRVDPCLVNVAWLQVGESSRIPAERFASQHGIRTAECSEGGQCLGWIEHGDWLRYEVVNIGKDIDKLQLRVASASTGGAIEVRLDSPDGKLLGRQIVSHTGGWQSWTTVAIPIEPQSGNRALCLVFKDPNHRSNMATPGLWFATVDGKSTTILAQFQDANPNESTVEINVRQSVFYPSKPGINYLTVRGFEMRHAATPWAPPTAEQIGLIGTHWSKGWIIENNDVRYSVCTGITLAKHGDEFDNTSANTATGYLETIHRALARGWSRENIGSHVVRNNHIAHCEQAGIVGSMGAAFSEVSGNEIHDIHVRRLFTGAEMGGIKFHGAIDTVIRDNHIYRTSRGIWLDWMTQGTRVTRNLLHDNGPSEDLFVEVNHGPFLVDHNIFLSGNSLRDWSQGGTYAHNLFAGNIIHRPEMGRATPYHPAHSTKIAGLHKIPGGDSRFYNNIFFGGGLATYDAATLPVFMAGNVFLNGAKPSRHESDPLVGDVSHPGPSLAVRPDGTYLELPVDASWLDRKRPLVTTELLGKATIPGLPFVQPDDSPYRLASDYLRQERSPGSPFPGPFTLTNAAKKELQVAP